MFNLAIRPAHTELPSEATIRDHNERARASIQLLESRYSGLIRIDPRLNRKYVSFQANKATPILRWYKYKEGFSGDLVSRYLNELDFPNASILDPFAGSGTTLARCTEAGFSCEGIELLPIGQLIINTRFQLTTANVGELLERVNYWQQEMPWKQKSASKSIPSLKITIGAYPPETERSISGYLQKLHYESSTSKNILTLALMAILESVSFTRKDGQYLRWDYRSGRGNLKSQFHKGRILPFDEAISTKLLEIAEDLATLSAETNKNDLCRLHSGSCLDILPQLETESFGGVITSPPYCNRYDYTRTYALEHALLGVGEDDTKQLRQAMLTCTVENRQKTLNFFYREWQKAVNSCWSVEAFSDIVAALTEQSRGGQLNNPNISRMVVGYFEEMACVIMELSRVLIKGGKIVMVNDNVRYGGIDIPVDCILSEIAGNFGLKTLEISTLARGKGNSSQQMGAHGRQELRKAVYIWEKI
ncbi:MAG: hypothetical protein ACXU8U_02520 [Asticcacaulis sp.]